MAEGKREQAENTGALRQPVNVVLVSLASQYVHSSLAPWCLIAGLDAYAESVYRTVVVEGTVNELPDAVLARIIKAQPAVLGISCCIWNITYVANLLPPLRAALPECVIVLGGPEVGHRAEDAMIRYPQADYLIAGEGELPFAFLLDALCGLRNFSEVPGLCFRTASGLKIREPFVHETMQPSPYSPAYFSALGGRIAYLETSRGCPFSCTFCLSGGGEKLRAVPLERAREEILLLANSGAGTVKLVDRTFNADKARAREILRFIADHAGRDIPEGVTFHFEIAGDLMDEAALSLVESSPAGLFQFEIGLQSMDETTLRRVRRRTDMALLKKQVRRLIACGKAHVHLDLIAGLPGEGLKEFASGFNQAYSLRPHALQLGFLKLIHGSVMRGEPETYPCRYDPEPPYQVLATPWLSEEDLKVLHVVEHALDKLHNSGRFVKTLFWLTGQARLQPFDLLLALGRAMQKAEETQGRLSLDHLTNNVFDCLRALLPQQKSLLRDLLLQDRLASTLTTVLPECLKQKDTRRLSVKRALDRFHPRQAGVTRAFGFLYAEDGDRVVFCDYREKDPVTGLYPLRIVPVAECLAGKG